MRSERGKGHLRDQLKAGLSATAQGDESGPSVSDLAEKIKAIKATNTIEATPQRVRQIQSIAEEPVTARIRRRAESMSTSESAGEAAVPEGTGAPLSPEPSHAQSTDSSAPSQERLAVERQKKSDGPPGPD